MELRGRRRSGRMAADRADRGEARGRDAGRAVRGRGAPQRVHPTPGTFVVAAAGAAGPSGEAGSEGVADAGGGEGSRGGGRRFPAGELGCGRGGRGLPGAVALGLGGIRAAAPRCGGGVVLEPREAGDGDEPHGGGAVGGEAGRGVDGAGARLRRRRAHGGAVARGGAGVEAGPAFGIDGNPRVRDGDRACLGGAGGERGAHPGLRDRGLGGRRAELGDAGGGHRQYGQGVRAPQPRAGQPALLPGARAQWRGLGRVVAVCGHVDAAVGAGERRAHRAHGRAARAP